MRSFALSAHLHEQTGHTRGKVHLHTSRLCLFMNMWDQEGLVSLTALFTMLQLCQLVAACASCAAASGEVLQWAVSEIVNYMRQELKQSPVMGARAPQKKQPESNSSFTGHAAALMVALVSKVGLNRIMGCA
jgi:hypothetical protein